MEIPSRQWADFRRLVSGLRREKIRPFIGRTLDRFSDETSLFLVDHLKKSFPVESETTGLLKQAISRRVTRHKPTAEGATRRDFVGVYGQPGVSYADTPEARDPRLYGRAAEFGSRGGRRYISEEGQERLLVWAQAKGWDVESVEDKEFRRLVAKIARYGTEPIAGGEGFFFRALPPRDPTPLNFIRQVIWPRIVIEVKTELRKLGVIK